MEYLQLASAIVIIYTSIIPLYIARRVFRQNKWFFVISAMLGLGLFIHGLYHFSAFLGNILLKISFEFVSALMIFALTIHYTYLRRKKYGN